MAFADFKDCVERSPIIAAVSNERFSAALESPVEIIFHLKATLKDIPDYVLKAHKAGKKLLIHIDLAEGIGKDKAAVEYLAHCGVDGILTTRSQLVRYAADLGLVAVQRFFALDSKGVAAIFDLLESSRPDMIEIMPGVASKVIKHFSSSGIPVIAGGLIETKAEVTEALINGAEAVSTGMPELWYI